ncbi:MAG: DUF192 domain-containing protein [Candidatus Caldarchaeum sp.]|uniref:DUF192 domain-containing protein n=1 Tax=Caldiarchaeum subterraneum TaxID=311458 RepID=A0A7C4I3C4_CALS0|nr:DUF192 domain-containing protein [Candidatus Caldarchaeales archaeon]
MNKPLFFAAAFLTIFLGILSSFFFLNTQNQTTTTSVIKTSESIATSEKPLEPYVKIREAVFSVEIADDDAERGRGLSGREKLPENRGMLFVFEKPGRYSFWMYEMRFALDIIWIDADGLVVHIEENLQPCTPNQVCQSYTPSSDAKYVLEINAGLVKKHGIVVGDFVEVWLGSAD